MFDPWIHGDKERKVKGTVNEDIRRILACDTLLVNGDRPSWGAGQEMVYARLFGSHVWTVYTGKPEDIPYWLDYHSDKVFKSLDECITWIKGEFKEVGK